MHQNTARAAGFQGSLEAWAQAGIRCVELSDRLLDDFLQSRSLVAGRRLLTELELTPVSGAAVLPDLWLPGPQRAASLAQWQRRCGQYAELGLDRIYCPSTTTRAVTAQDWAATPECIYEAAEIARQQGLTAMVEFTRHSTHLSALRSSLEVLRAAAHPNARLLFDFFHFWSAAGRLEDLDLPEPGELAHVHFQDVLDVPPASMDNNCRVIPGDGVVPVVQTLSKLRDKGYAGALSVELFRPEIVTGDAFTVAVEIRGKCEKLMREAGVLETASVPR